MAGGGALVVGNLTGGASVDLVQFPVDGSIEVYDPNGTLLGGMEGCSPTSAVTLDHNPALDRLELCVLDRDWFVRRYDGATGAFIDKFLMPRPTTASPASAMELPKRLVRTDPTTFGPAAFEFFAYAGTMFPAQRVGLGSGTQPVRVAYSASGLVASLSFADQHNFVIAGCRDMWQTAATGLADVPIGSGTQQATSLDRMAPEAFATGQAAVIAVDVPGDGPNLVFANPSGNVRVLSGFAANPTQQPFQAASPWSGGIGPSQSVGIVGDPGDQVLRLEALDVASLASGELDGNPATIDVVAGAMVPDAQGHTLFVLDIASGSAQRVASANVGAVSGIALGDVDGDGKTEIVVGTVEGRVRVYDRNLALIVEVDSAAMQVGQRGTMWVIEGDAGAEVPARLIFGHSQGVTAIDFAF